jgi:multidrug efflux pump subunit AcrB
MILGSASVLVFIVLLFLFRHLRVALVMLGIALFGVCGCILALFLTGTALNVGSYTGIIMIVGIIGENAIFTYLQYAHNRKEQGVDDSLTYAIGTRLRPKLMTALGAIAALVAHRAGHRYWRAIAPAFGYRRHRRIYPRAAAVAYCVAQHVAAGASQ